MSRWALAPLLVLALAPPAVAVDGVIEINQTRALAGGVTPGDTAGFPVTLSLPGSYRLTGNLGVADANSHGIEVLPANVSIDLNGFEIAGPVSCTGLGSGLSCGTGSGRGIQTTQVPGTSIRNGSIRGFASNAVSAGDHTQVRDLIVTASGDGIGVGAGSIVSGATVSRVAGNGIWVSSGSVVERSTSTSNRQAGIFLAGVGGSALGSSTRANGTNGIEAGVGSVIRDHNSAENETSGIHAGNGSAIIGCSAVENGLHGIRISSGSVVRDSSSILNGDLGILAEGNAQVTGNIASGNGDGGIRLDDGGLVSGNVASQNTGDGINSAGKATVVFNTANQNSGWGFRGTQPITNTLGGNNFVGNSTGQSINAIAIQCNVNDGVPFCPP